MSPHGATARGIQRVLIIEDSHADALRTKRLLREVGVENAVITEAETLKEAYERLQDGPLDLVLMDLHLGSENTLDHIGAFRAANPSAALIVLTGSSESELAEEALARGAEDYLCKDDLAAPILRRAVRYAVHRHQYHQQVRQSLVSRKIVRRLLSDVSRHSASSTGSRRDLGRSLASEVEAPDLRDYLGQLSAMGAGDFHLEGQGPDRYELRGSGGIEVSPGFSGPTCYLPLGFFEGAISHLTGMATLGAETQCQSQGHAECRFIVKTRGPGQGDKRKE